MLNIVIMGLGYIAPRVAKGIQYAKGANLYGVASRDINKAKQFAESVDCEHYYGNYEEMLNDEKVELVYLATPNHLHLTQIKECFKHGKHVICEKPLVSSSEEVKEIFMLSRKHRCFFMEAEKTLFTPLNVEIQKLIKEEAIGKVISIKADYSYNILKMNYPKEHWAFNKQYGGSSYDVGVYPICFSHLYANSKIKNIQAMAKTYENYECDFYACANIEYENGVMASVTSSWLYASKNRGEAYIYGDKGYLEIPCYWKGDSAKLVVDGIEKLIKVQQNSDFTGEIEHAVKCIEEGLIESPIMSEKTSLGIMKVVEIMKSAIG